MQVCWSAEVGRLSSVPCFAGKLEKDDLSVDTARQVLGMLQHKSVTMRLLLDSKIGMTVKSMRKHPDGKVAELASALTSKWKKVVSQAMAGAIGVGASKANDALKAQVKRDEPVQPVSSAKGMVQRERTAANAVDATSGTKEGKVTRTRHDWLKFYSKGKEGKPLSNFHRGTITVNGRTYPGGEQAFHGEKFFLASLEARTNMERSSLLAYAEQFLCCEDPMDAKRRGGKGEKGFRLKPEQLAQWNGGGADAVQRSICQAKIDTDEAVVQALMASGDRPLLHQDNRAKSDTPW